MSQVTLTIDGLSVTVPQGTTLLQAARSLGIKIPTLCHDDRLASYGACRLCLVEIRQGDRTKLVASCAYEAKEGLVVRTDTEKILRLRRLILELLWPASAALAREYGITSSRFEQPNSDCHLCGLCVRTCQEVTHRNAVYFEGRGIHRKIAFTPGMRDTCLNCRECFDICTGGLLFDQASRAYVEVDG